MTWRYFNLDEFRCNCCLKNEISTDLVDALDAIREQLGFPLLISSGYRCPAHNARVSSTGDNGPHTTGLAADIKIAGRQAYALLDKALEWGFTGIGINQRGDMSKRFIHLDLLSEPERFRPTIWTY